MLNYLLAPKYISTGRGSHLFQRLSRLCLFVCLFFRFPERFLFCDCLPISFRHGIKNGCNGYDMCRHELHSPLFWWIVIFSKSKIASISIAIFDDVTIPKQRDCSHWRYTSFLTVRDIKVMKRVFSKKTVLRCPNEVFFNFTMWSNKLRKKFSSRVINLT